MDPDLFITIAFCSLVLGLAGGAGAVLALSAHAFRAQSHGDDDQLRGSMRRGGRNRCTER
jgi:hypothetical protein